MAYEISQLETHMHCTKCDSYTISSIEWVLGEWGLATVLSQFIGSGLNGTTALYCCVLAQQ